MKTLKYILLTTLYLLLATACRKDEEPTIDRGKQATTDEEMMQMIVGEWKYVNAEQTSSPGSGGESKVREFNKDSTYRQGVAEEDYEGGGIVQDDSHRYTVNFEDSVYYKIRNGLLYRWYTIPDSLREFDYEASFNESRNVEVYENILIVDDREYERL